jgi:hypothetical protein
MKYAFEAAALCYVDGGMQRIMVRVDDAANYDVFKRTSVIGHWVRGLRSLSRVIRLEYHCEREANVYMYGCLSCLPKLVGVKRMK